MVVYLGLLSQDHFNLARALFDEALGMEKAQRNAFLDARCPNPEIASEVRKLLQAHESGSALLDHAGAGMMQGIQVLSRQGSSVPAPALAPGQVLGPYEVIRRLAVGGMGEVYLAHDSRLGRQVALKLLAGFFRDDPQRLQRFQREARAASALNHPNVATIYEIGETAGASYLAMEYVEGRTLAARLQGQPLPSVEIVEIATQVADALDEAHRLGITHRDIKPANIMLTPRGQVKVIDFGISKLRGMELPGESETFETVPGMVIGTAQYMSPEQALGKEVDHRSDLFSLGLVMYEMAAGRRPFSGASATEAIERLIHSEPDAIARWNYELPAELERIVRKCLEKERERRYQSARELCVDLRNLRRDTDSAPRAAGLAASPRRGGPRRAALIAIPVTLLALAGGAVYWNVLVTGKTQHLGAMKSVAVLPFKNIGDRPEDTDYLADGISEALITRLTRLPNVRVIPWVTAERYRGSAQPPQALAREMRVDALLTGSLRRAGDRIAVTVSLIDGESGMQTWADQFEDQLADIFAVQRRIALGTATQLKGRLTGQQQQAIAQAAAHSAEAYELYLRGQSAFKQRDTLNLALDLFQRALKLDSDLAEAYVGIGGVQYRRLYAGLEGDASSPDRVADTYQHALSLNPELASAYNGLIAVSWLNGRGEDGLRYGRKVASLGLEDADNLYARASAYYFGGLWDKAIPVLRRVLEIDPANEPASARIVPSYLFAGEFHQAVEAGEKYLRTFGDKTRAHAYLAAAYHSLGDFPQAELHYQRAAQLAPDDLFPYFALGNLYRQNGRPEDARRVWTRGLAVAEEKRHSAPRNPGLHMSLAKLYGNLGDWRGLSEEEAWFLRETPESGYVFAELGLSFARFGDPDRAVRYLQRALRLGYVNYYEKNILRTEGLDGLNQSASYKEFLKEWTQTIRRLHQEY